MRIFTIVYTLQVWLLHREIGLHVFPELYSQYSLQATIPIGSKVIIFSYFLCQLYSVLLL